MARGVYVEIYGPPPCTECGARGPHRPGCIVQRQIDVMKARHTDINKMRHRIASEIDERYFRLLEMMHNSDRWTAEANAKFNRMYEDFQERFRLYLDKEDE